MKNTKVNSYEAMSNKHQEMINSFPMKFAFSQQFEMGMRDLGLEPTDTDKVYKGFAGGFYLKTDAPKLHEILDTTDRGLEQAVAADTTGEGFIFEMFNYELSNHEYVITMDTADTLHALGLTTKEINENPAMRHGLDLAKRAQYEWAQTHDF